MNVANNNQRRISGKLNKYFGISGAYFPLSFAVRMCWKGAMKERHRLLEQCPYYNYHIHTARRDCYVHGTASDTYTLLLLLVIIIFKFRAHHSSIPP